MKVFTPPLVLEEGLVRLQKTRKQLRDNIRIAERKLRVVQYDIQTIESICREAGIDPIAPPRKKAAA